MIEIASQKKPACPACKHKFVHIRPFSLEDEKELGNYPFDKILKSRITGTLKERSVLQLRLYWGCCRYLAEQLSDQDNILSGKDVDFDIKTRVAKDNPSMIKRFKMIGGIAYIEPLSVAFPNLKHLEACDYFDKAFKLMSGMTNQSPDEFVESAKATFGR